MDVQIQERPHVHAYASAAEVPWPLTCNECGKGAEDPLVCMECQRVICSSHLEDTRTASERCRDHGLGGECGWCCPGVP